MRGALVLGAVLVILVMLGVSWASATTYGAGTATVPPTRPARFFPSHISTLTLVPDWLIVNAESTVLAQCVVQ